MPVAIDDYSLQPIGYIDSPFREKFGIPRQPGLATEAQAQLRLKTEFGIESVRGLETFSHLWIQFVFHATQGQGWRQTVRPPRLGGNQRVGVFASRSMFRPNPLGLSVVRLTGIETTAEGVVLSLSGGDFLHGTPVLDIKPYLPYADAIKSASGGFAEQAPAGLLKVDFNNTAQRQCQIASQRLGVNIEKLVKQVLALDPRPAYHGRKKPLSGNAEKAPKRVYSMRLYDFDLRWHHCENDVIEVLELEASDT